MSHEHEGEEDVDDADGKRGDDGDSRLQGHPDVGSDGLRRGGLRVGVAAAQSGHGQQDAHRPQTHQRQHRQHLSVVTDTPLINSCQGL